MGCGVVCKVKLSRSWGLPTPEEPGIASTKSRVALLLEGHPPGQ